jgi:Na+-translocating ferredoxin:NAD+ oxidoreductase RnfG subunit
MSETLIGILLGLAALVVAFLSGKSSEKKQTKIDQLEADQNASKLAEAIKAANDSVPDNDLRKWMRDNAKK